MVRRALPMRRISFEMAPLSTIEATFFSSATTTKIMHFLLPLIRSFLFYVGRQKDRSERKNNNNKERERERERERDLRWRTEGEDDEDEDEGGSGESALDSSSSSSFM
mgnify:CR=1 FL=1